MAERAPTRCTAVLVHKRTALFAGVFSVDGAYCLTGGHDRLVRLWNPYSNECIREYEGHNYEVRAIDVTTDSAHFASCGSDKAVLVWDVESGSVVRRLRGHRGDVNAVAFAAQQSVLITGGYDRSVRIWDLRASSFEPLDTMSQFKDAVMSVQPVDSAIVCACVDGSVATFDVRRGACTWDFVGRPVSSACVSNDGNCTLVSCLDSTVRLLDRSNGELLAEYRGHKHTESKSNCLLTRNDAYVVAGSEDGTVVLWDLVDDKSVAARLAGHVRPVTSVAYSRTRNALLSTSVDGTARLWQE
jgi:mitogen-activated protein kinase organizer 1